jgi:hypothetical protein
MNPQQYRQFLNNPSALLNAQGNVRQIRFDSSMMREIPNSVSRTVQSPGAVPLHYQYSAARVTPVTLRYDDTGIPATSAVWVSRSSPNVLHQRDRAYYLQWAADSAYAIDLGYDAQLFFTAELTGCGIMVFKARDRTIVVHHNVQVSPSSPTFMQRLFEGEAARERRETAHIDDVRTQALLDLAQDILASHPGITGGTLLSAQQYGDQARVFGIQRGGQWRLYVNYLAGGRYRTDLLYQ